MTLSVFSLGSLRQLLVSSLYQLIRYRLLIAYIKVSPSPGAPKVLYSMIPFQAG